MNLKPRFSSNWLNDPKVNRLKMETGLQYLQTEPNRRPNLNAAKHSQINRSEP